MGAWEDDVIARLRAKEQGRPDQGATSASSESPLLAAFHHAVEATSSSVATIGSALAYDVRTETHDDDDVHGWTWRMNRLMVRLDASAGKFFLSLSTPATMTLVELWEEEGTIYQLSEGILGEATIDAVVKRLVEAFFDV